MASQQLAQDAEQQHAVTVIPVDSGRDTSSACNDTGFQPLAVDQQFIAVDGRLYDASVLVEESRKIMYQYRAMLATATKRCAAYEDAFKEEQRCRRECAQAYRALYTQHEKAANDLVNMANKQLLLQHELEVSQATICTYESTVQEYKQRLDGKDGEMDSVEQNIAKIKQLEARTAELEQEKLEMARGYGNALSNAADRILATEGKMRELEDRLREWQRETSVEQTISVRPAPSPALGKRPCEDEHEVNAQQQGVPAKRGRKRKQAAKKEAVKKEAAKKEGNVKIEC